MKNIETTTRLQLAISCDWTVSAKYYIVDGGDDAVDDADAAFK